MIADPGERQIGEDFVSVGQTIEGDGVSSGRDAALARQHHAFRATGRARREQDNRRRAAFAVFDRRIERGGGFNVGQGLFAGGDDCGDRPQARVVIVRKAALFVVKNMREARQTLGDGEELVDLLLVLCHSHDDVDEAEHGSKLVGG